MTATLVWHYTDAHGLLSIVRNHVLWATASGFLNDHLEIALGVQRLREALTERAERGDAIAALVQERLDRSDVGERGPSSGTFFILSAAAHWDLLAMWRCYGGPEESYAIGLDSSVPLPVLAAPGTAASIPKDSLLRARPWTPVAYSTAQQRRLADRAMDLLPQDRAQWQRVIDAQSDRLGLLNDFAEVLDELEQALVLVKHEGFVDEREVRHTVSVLQRPDAGGWDGIVRYRASRYGVAPHLWLTGPSHDREVITETVAPLPIRAVAISPSPNGPDAAVSLRAMLRTHGYDVPILRSEIPFRG